MSTTSGRRGPAENEDLRRRRSGHPANSRPSASSTIARKPGPAGRDGRRLRPPGSRPGPTRKPGALPGGHDAATGKIARTVVPDGPRRETDQAAAEPEARSRIEVIPTPGAELRRAARPRSSSISEVQGEVEPQADATPARRRRGAAHSSWLPARSGTPRPPPQRGGHRRRSVNLHAAHRPCLLPGSRRSPSSIPLAGRKPVNQAGARPRQAFLDLARQVIQAVAWAVGRIGDELRPWGSVAGPGRRCRSAGLSPPCRVTPQPPALFLGGFDQLPVRPGQNSASDTACAAEATCRDNSAEQATFQHRRAPGPASVVAESSHAADPPSEHQRHGLAPRPTTVARRNSPPSGDRGISGCDGPFAVDVDLHPGQAGQSVPHGRSHLGPAPTWSRPSSARRCPQPADGPAGIVTITEHDPVDLPLQAVRSGRATSSATAGTDRAGCRR